MKQWPEKGTAAVRTADASTKNSNGKPQAASKTSLGIERKGNGMGEADVGHRDLDMDLIIPSRSHNLHSVLAD